VNPEIFKLLNPKTARLDDLRGGVPTLTADDINAACAGANDIGLDVLLARVCDDRQAQQRAFYSIYQHIVQLAIDRKWVIRAKGKEKLRSLTQLIIFELTTTPRCPRCHGTKFNQHLNPCKACDGTGFYKIKDSQRARAIGVSPSTWQRVWLFRHAEVLSLIATCEADTLRSIGRKLKRGLS